MVVVLQKLWQVEELWNEFLDVGHVGGAGRHPGGRDTVEQAVRQVKVSSLSGWVDGWMDG